MTRYRNQHPETGKTEEKGKRMDYTFEVRISLEKPLTADYVQMVVEKAVREINVSPFIGEKESPAAVDIRMKSGKK